MPKVTNVSTGKPRVAGSFYRAPLGSVLPLDAESDLDEAFKELGYSSDDGLTNTNSPESETVKAWGGDTVLTLQTSKSDQFKVKLIEVLNPDVLAAIYGSSNVTGDIESGMTVKANRDEPEEAAYVIDMIMREGVLKRIVIPDAKVSEIGDITYKDNEATGFDITLEAMPDEEGQTHYEYFTDGGGDEPAPGPTPGELGALTVTSDEGAETGKTAISVSEEKTEGNVYKIKLAAEPTEVTYDMNVQNWTAWDGESDIVAEADQVITVVEATSDYKVRKAGSATVVVKA